MVVEDLRRRLQQEKCAKKGNVREHFSKLRTMREDLAAMGHTPGEDEFYAIILGSLPYSFEPFISARNATSSVVGHVLSPNKLMQALTRSLLCPAGSDWNWLQPVGFRLEILDHSIGQTVGNFSNFSNRIPIGTSGTGRFYRFRVQSIPTGTKWNQSEPVRKSQTSVYIVGDHLIIF